MALNEYDILHGTPVQVKGLGPGYVSKITRGNRITRFGVCTASSGTRGGLDTEKSIQSSNAYVRKSSSW